MSRTMPPEAIIAVAVEKLPHEELSILERAARTGNWIGKYGVAAQDAAEMVIDAIVGEFRAWCRNPYSCPHSVRGIFERIYGDALKGEL